MELWQVLVWAAATVLLIISEIVTVQLVSIWFAAGALCAFIASLLGWPPYIQILIFIVVSVILLIATRPLAKKFNSVKKVSTNADTIIGMKCIVTEDIDNLKNTGRVLVNGLYWAARSCDDKVTYTVEDECIVTDIQGVKAIVAPLSDK